MRDIAMLIPCWKSPELLKVCIPSLLKSITTNSEIIVILNEADKPSIKYLDSIKIRHIDKKRNFGPGAVDFAIPYIKKQKFKYISNINSDMVFQNGWDKLVIDMLEANYPCSVSLALVGPVKLGLYNYDTFGRFVDVPNIHQQFNKNIKDGKYTADLRCYYTHPITCRTEDLIAVNGYSNNMKECWIKTHGKGLDDDFPYRLWKRNKNFKFIRHDKAFVYHAPSINSRKIEKPDRVPGGPTFQRENGMEIGEFAKLIRRSRPL